MTDAPTSRHTVLVVDDEPEVRSSTAMLLEALDFTVLEAGDATAALEILEANPAVDLLFSDLVLPVMDGVALGRAAQQVRPSLKVLLTTGRAEAAAETDFPVIAKPFRMAELSGAIDALLSGG